MNYPKLNLVSGSGSRTSKEITDVFAGYNHNLRIADGEFFDTWNLTNDSYPLLSSRKKRGLFKELTAGQGLIEKDALCYVDDGTLYVNELATSITGLSAGEKQLVSMGAYIVIFPDKVYYNTADPTDYGSMEASWQSTGTVTYTPCKADGTAYTIGSEGDSEPIDPENGDTWIDTGDGGRTMRQYSSSEGCWLEITEVFTKIGFTTQGSLPALFKEYDGVEISGSSFDELNGQKILYAVGGEENSAADYAVVVGLVNNGGNETQDVVKIQRKVPQMDFVCECRNRLWGCFYGNDGEQNLNEIYCCALGDFKNWSQYLGLSTDSWRGSVGSDGQWTGAVNYLGEPIFFKENRIHRVSVSSEGAHRIDEMVCRGVQKGSHRSLQVVNETLYYKSRSDVVAYQGGFPVGISAAFGEEVYDSAVGGTFGQRYYLSMKDKGGAWHLFVYNITRSLWLHEDDMHAEDFARVDDEFYCLSGDKIWALNGTAGEPETEIRWMAETGILYYAFSNKKYVSRYNIRGKMEKGAEMEIYIEYDSDGKWQKKGKIKQAGTGSTMLPIRPRRCDHMRLRIVGKGEAKIFSITKILAVGSDI